MNSWPEQPGDDGGGLPPKLARDLKAAYGPRLRVPGAVDDAVRAAARNTWVDRPATRSVLARIGSIGGAVAAAAAIALCVWLAYPRPASSPVVGPLASQIPGDINGDGRVDIVDAYLLQRRIERREPLAPQWDVTADGRVDSQDARVLAMRAVKLPSPSGATGGRS